MADPGSISLSAEVAEFETTADRIALGDLQIRKNFARDVMTLFAVANLFVMVGLGFVFWQDSAQLWAGNIKPTDRIVNGDVIIALLGATTIQLGTVIFTITRAIFQAPNRTAAGGD